MAGGRNRTTLPAPLPNQPPQSHAQIAPVEFTTSVGPAPKGPCPVAPPPCRHILIRRNSRIVGETCVKPQRLSKTPTTESFNNFLPAHPAARILQYNPPRLRFGCSKRVFSQSRQRRMRLEPGLAFSTVLRICPQKNPASHVASSGSEKIPTSSRRPRRNHSSPPPVETLPELVRKRRLPRPRHGKEIRPSTFGKNCERFCFNQPRAESKKVRQRRPPLVLVSKCFTLIFQRISVAGSLKSPTTLPRKRMVVGLRQVFQPSNCLGGSSGVSSLCKPIGFRRRAGRFGTSARKICHPAKRKTLRRS